MHPHALLVAAIGTEWEERRVFLWLPVAAGVGVLLYLNAEREPVLWLPLLLTLGTGALTLVTRHKPLPFCLCVGAFAICAGFVSAELRGQHVAAPMLDRIRIAKLTGFIEEVDPRPSGARFILLIQDGGELDPDHRPARVRLTTRRSDPIEAGMFVELTARLLPPSRAALPDGYDFARDAYFAGIGAVGSALGRIRPASAPVSPDLPERLRMALDRARNELAFRVNQTVGGGDAGAVAAAMVTGKRDLLSQNGRDIIREAGIFHIITIAGVQMTLVAGLLYGGLRRILALSSTLALRYPIKKWAAAFALMGAVAYDIGTGSRIGTQRALFMTVIMLGAVLFDRRAFTMRNLAFAALAVIGVEPEAIAGASFQLSFAAVAALITVQEARMRGLPDDDPYVLKIPTQPPRAANALLRRAGHGWSAISGLFVATIFATTATASFMAAEFHELSPYVFIGNPLTLTIIELFAVPGALIGTFLYPLGLDAWVWHWVGLGIRFVLWVAGYLASAPASTVHLRGFAPWALPCLALALLSIVIWRTAIMRLTALPWLVLGLLGATSGPKYDVIVAPTGDSVALRGQDGALAILGHSNAFTTVQWLRADGDARELGSGTAPPMAPSNGRCDKLGCVAPVMGGQILSVVADAAAFEEDCKRADMIVTPLYAPASCAAEVIIDRGSLERTGAVALWHRNGAWAMQPARRQGENRPWSPAPKPWRPHIVAVAHPGGEGTSSDVGGEHTSDDREPVRIE